MELYLGQLSEVAILPFERPIGRIKTGTNNFTALLDEVLMVSHSDPSITRYQ